ncbi:MAG TPA: hypothetical protein VFK89_08755 [Actinomycetota bacterium]|nr:hypothetical protein [Actinomycetota bacterium]
MGYRSGSVALVVALALSFNPSPSTGSQRHHSTPRKHPNSIDRPPKDGCERDPGGLIAGTSPQWAYVHRSRTPRYLRGKAVEARPTYTDLFRAHDSYDMNIFFRPTRRYRHYLGTANISKAQTQDKDEQGTMEVEWEQRAYPLWAWPTQGDRVELMGSWIWDCGHWGPQDFNDPNYFAPGTQPGETVTGERTEIHSPRMVIVHRKQPSIPHDGAAQADVLISSQGTFARAVQNHAAGFCTKPEDVCSQRVPVNDRNYSFKVTAPPRPSRSATLHYRVVDHHSVHAPDPRITRRGRTLHVVVPFKGFHRSKKQRMVFAKSFYVGWSRQRRDHLRIKITRLEWLAELDTTNPGQCPPNEPCTGEPQDSQPPDEVNVYVDVAGQWAMLKAPELLSIAPGDVVHIGKRFDAWLPRDAFWRVMARGRECDQPQMRECPVPQEAGLNDDGGVFEDFYPGTQGLTGTYTSTAMAQGCLDAGAEGCFRLTYKIDLLRDVPTSKAARARS